MNYHPAPTLNVEDAPLPTKQTGRAFKECRRECITPDYRAF
jgi:hypothetical protein